MKFRTPPPTPDWGIDYLKYDWCSYDGNIAKGDNSIPALQKPYDVMRDALDKSESRHRLQSLPIWYG